MRVWFAAVASGHLTSPIKTQRLRHVDSQADVNLQQHQVLAGDPDPRAQRLGVKGKSSCATPSNRSSLIAYADGMVALLHASAPRQLPPTPPPPRPKQRAHIGVRSPRSRKLGGTRTRRGWMTLCVCARVTSRLSTTSAQVSGIHANKRTHTRTHARRLGHIILPSSFLSCNVSPPGCNRCITTICHPLVGMNHHSIIT